MRVTVKRFSTIEGSPKVILRVLRDAGLIPADTQDMEDALRILGPNIIIEEETA